MAKSNAASPLSCWFCEICNADTRVESKQHQVRAKFWQLHVQISIQFHELFTRWSNHTLAISLLLLLGFSLAHQFYFQLFEILAACALKNCWRERYRGRERERVAFSGKNQWCVRMKHDVEFFQRAHYSPAYHSQLSCREKKYPCLSLSEFLIANKRQRIFTPVVSLLDTITRWFKNYFICFSRRIEVDDNLKTCFIMHFYKYVH